VLPVWHNLKQEDVLKFSPTLAGKVGVSTYLGLAVVAAAILRTIHKEDLAKLDVPAGKTEKHRELMRQIREGELSRLLAVGNEKNDFIVVYSRSAIPKGDSFASQLLQLRKLIKEIISGDDITDNTEGTDEPHSN
jgi:hypothetical protein